MGVGGMFIAPILISAIGLDTLIHEIIVVSVSGLTCVLIFVLFAALLRIEEFYWVVGLLRNRLLNRP
jgi:hypothetical protein